MTALLLAALVAGALISGPAWIAYGAKRTIEDIERYHRRKERANGDR